MIEAKKFKTQHNYAFIDEATKREIRRKLLKAIAIPGYQVPYSSPEMPIARGWGMPFEGRFMCSNWLIAGPATSH